MKKLNIVVDLETLSRRPDAAIISIAAVPFILDIELLRQRARHGLTGVPAYRPEKEEETVLSEWAPFHETIDATTCALAGLHFEMDTVKFWANMGEEVKSSILNENRVSLAQALDDFMVYLDRVKSVTGADDIVIWSQGMDFDIPILKNALYKFAGDKNFDLPWKYYNVRDARTYMIEGLNLMYGDKELEHYKDLLQKRNDLKKHNCLHDAIWTALNVIDIKMSLLDNMGKYGDKEETSD